MVFLLFDGLLEAASSGRDAVMGVVVYGAALWMLAKGADVRLLFWLMAAFSLVGSVVASLIFGGWMTPLGQEFLSVGLAALFVRDIPVLFYLHRSRRYRVTYRNEVRADDPFAQFASVAEVASRSSPPSG